MALESAGVTLEAKGFKDYIKNLDAIEKKQREAFEAEFKGTDKSYAQVTKAAKAYERELKALAKAEEKAAQEAEALAQAEKEVADEMKAAEKAAADKAAAQPKARIGAGFQAIKGGDIGGGIGQIAGGIGAIGPAATIATGGLAAVAAGAVAAGAAIGVIGVSVLNVAKDTDTATKDIAANLGISAPEAAAKYNDSLQAIWADNPQAQFAEIADAITLTERALDISPAGLEQVAGDALKISQQFGEDLPSTIGATEQLIERFGLSSQEATDLLTHGLQNIPADDLIDSVGEYSNLFAEAGFTAAEFFSVMQTGAAGGVLGTDKAADAVKEFQIGFLEGTTGMKEGLSALGLNFDQLTADFNAGRTDIGGVFTTVVDKIGETDMSIAANRAAVAGLGSQFEDLGAAAVAGINTTEVSMAAAAGATDTLDEKFNTLGGAFESIKRSALVALAPIGKVILDLANSFVPKIKAAFEAVRPAIDAFTARVVPAFEFAGEALGRLGQAIGGASTGVSAFESVLSATAYVIEGLAGGIEILARVVTTFKQIMAFAKAGAAAFGELINQVFMSAIENAKAFGSIIGKVFTGQFKAALDEAKNFEMATPDFSAVGDAAVDAFMPVKEVTTEVKEEIDAISDTPPITLDTTPAVQALQEEDQALQMSQDQIDAYNDAIKQAEDMQRSWAREAEDTALKLARANEDIARKQGRAVAKLQEKQAGDRTSLLESQAKKLEDFEKDRKSQIAKAEGDIRKARQAAAEKRKQDQRKLQRDLKKSQEKFNLSQLQSERRFKLQEQRLLAEGDVLGLKQLREDQALKRQEEKENFDSSQREKVEDAKQTEKDQSVDLEQQLSALKTNLEDKRAELLKSFDEELIAQQEAQAVARQEQQAAFEEEAADRAIALAREEEDRRISQARQLEDMGRSWAEQGLITEEGAGAIAGELEKVFGIGGAADNIMTGFADKTKSDFKGMMDDIMKTISKKPIKPKVKPKVEAEIEPPKEPLPVPVMPAREERKKMQRFATGGVVQGPIGAEVPVIAHAGETILPTHQAGYSIPGMQTAPQQQSYQMTSPAISSQDLNVNLGGEFQIKGGEVAGKAAVEAAMEEMIQSFRIATQRLARRN